MSSSIHLKEVESEYDKHMYVPVFIITLLTVTNIDSMSMFINRKIEKKM